MRGPTPRTSARQSWGVVGSSRVKAFVSLGVILAAPLAILCAYLSFAGPRTLGAVDLYALNRPASYTFVDEHHQVLGHAGATAGDRLTLNDMPAYLPAAFISMEDRRFYYHGSADIFGVLRAAYANFHAGHTVAGGSSITQQTAKLLFLNSQRTMSRKVQELATSWSLERDLSKEQILTLYLNRVYLGGGAYGVDAAARVYFGKSGRDVSLPEAAMLAALTRAPSVFSPRRDLAGAQARAALVLDAMVETKSITPEQAADAKANPATIIERSLDMTRDYFFDAAALEAQALTVGMNGDLVILTTLEPDLQKAARTAADEMFLAQGQEAHASQVAMLVMNTDGAIRAMVGGRNYLDSQFNRVTQAKRQPGSSFKAMVYLTAMERGLTPDDTISGGALNVHGYRPQNYGGAHYGEMTLAEAFAKSVNTAAVRLITRVGEFPVVATAHRLGISSELHPNASLALGSSEVTPLELTRAYGAFATGGVAVTPYMVREVRTVSGTVLYHRGEPEPERVIEPQFAKEMDKMLRGVVSHGTGRAADLDEHVVAGKTGTSSDYHDAWFIGYSEDLLGSVWLGNDDFSSMNKITGGTIPAKLWRKVMTTAFDIEKRDKENMPEELTPPKAPAVAEITPQMLPAVVLPKPQIVPATPRPAAPIHVAEDKPINDEAYSIALKEFAQTAITMSGEKALTAALNAHSLALRGTVH